CGNRVVYSRRRRVHGLFRTQSPGQSIDDDVLQPQWDFGGRLFEKLKASEFEDRGVLLRIGPTGLQCRRPICSSAIEIFGGVDNRDESLWQSQEVPLNEVAVFKRR